jgi:hypothetical protein
MHWLVGVLHFSWCASPHAPPYCNPQGIPRRGEDGRLLARTVCRLPSEHKYVPDGLTIDNGELMSFGIQQRRPGVLGGVISGQGSGGRAALNRRTCVALRCAWLCR